MEAAEWYDDRTPLSFMGWSCPLFSGQTSAADPYAQMSVNHVTPAIEPDKPPKSRPTSSLSEIGQDPQRVLDLARREHIPQFWDSETDPCAGAWRLWLTDLCGDSELFWGVFCEGDRTLTPTGSRRSAWPIPIFAAKESTIHLWKHPMWS